MGYFEKFTLPILSKLRSITSTEFLWRRKKPNEANQTSRVLSSLGIGRTIGISVHLLPGIVEFSTSGPAIIFSFIFAAIVSLLAGFCCAELRARVPNAKSTYICCYILLGEPIAFIIGWNCLIECLLSVAILARGLSGYTIAVINYVFERKLITQLYTKAGYDVKVLALLLIITSMYTFFRNGELVRPNLVIIVNGCLLIVIVIFGVFIADFDNWDISPHEIPDSAGFGGFQPYGTFGTISGAAKCVYAYIGIENIILPDDVNTPNELIVHKIICLVSTAFLGNLALSTVVSLIVPYFQINPTAPILTAFHQRDWGVEIYMLAFGGVIGLLANLFLELNTLGRVLKALSQDGLIYKWLGKIDGHKEPFAGLVFSSTIAGLLATFYNLDNLISWMAIEVLFTYCIVALCVVYLRYCQVDENLISDTRPLTLLDILQQYFFNARDTKISTSLSSNVVIFNLLLFAPASYFLALNIQQAHLWIPNPLNWVSKTLSLTLILFVSLYNICRQPINSEKFYFEVPVMPLLPALSLFLNIFLMIYFAEKTWIDLYMTISIGYLAYMFYGVRNSVERNKPITNEDGEALLNRDNNFKRLY